MVKTKRRNNASKTSRRSRRNTRVQRNNNSKRKSNKVRHRKRGGNGDDPKLTKFLNVLNEINLPQILKDVGKLPDEGAESGLTKEQFKYVKILLEVFKKKCINDANFTIIGGSECNTLLEHFKFPIDGLYPKFLDADNKKYPEIYAKLAASEHQDYKELANLISLIETYFKITVNKQQIATLRQKRP